MKQEHKDLALNIKRLIEEAGVKMGTVKAKSMEACILAGYILAKQDAQTPAAYLELLLQSGRQLTDEAKKG